MTDCFATVAALPEAQFPHAPQPSPQDAPACACCSILAANASQPSRIAVLALHERAIRFKALGV
jgi:hypothetical protein